MQEDNSFAVQGLAPGSYMVEVSNPTYTYEPCRVDVTNKGKMRARRVNNVQPSQVVQVAYPLKLKSLGRTNYFQKREEWRATDVLFNPMIWMMVMPLFLVSVLPKLMSDPDTKKELEQVQQSMNVQQNMPEISEIMANLFGGGATSSSGDKRRPRQTRATAGGSGIRKPH